MLSFRGTHELIAGLSEYYRPARLHKWDRRGKLKYSAFFSACLYLLGSKTKRTCGRWLRLSHVTVSWLSQPARHAASVRSRTIMKKQPSVGGAAEADLSNVHRAFLPRLTESTADRWIKATTQLFLSLNGEENGMWSSLSCLIISSAFYSLLKLALRIVVTDRGFLSGRSPPCMLPACLSGS